MLKTFISSSHPIQPSEMRKKNEDMLELLDALAAREIPSSGYSIADLEQYLASLIKGQIISKNSAIGGYWSALPDHSKLDTEARIEFIFRTTYIATATLSLALFEHPITTLLIPSYLECLTKGLKFCAARRLKGHGYEADDGMIDAVKTLSKGKVPLLLDQNPDYCMPLKMALSEAELYMSEKLNSGCCIDTWGEDYSEGYRSALYLLQSGRQPLNNTHK